MSKVRMVKCTLVARREDADPVLEALQDAGIVHVAPIAVPAELMEGLEPGHTMRAIDDDADAIRAQLENRRHALANVAEAPARLQVTDKSVPEVLELVDALLHKRELAQEERAAVENKIATLEPWGDFDPDDLAAIQNKGVKVQFAVFTRDEWSALDQRKLTFAVVREEDQRVFVLLFDAGASDLKISDLEIPRERLSALKRRHDELDRVLADVNRELGRYSHYAPTLERMMEALSDRASLLEAIDSGVVSGPLFALEGYLPAENVIDLQRSLAPFEVAVSVDEPAEEDTKVPVKLQNNWFVSGFESVVKAFSGVSYREKDFTWAVGILFIIFGSLCLLDAGYGFLLLLTGVILKVRGSEAFGKVFLLTGFFAVIVGSLSGQFFGLIIGQHIYKDLLPPLTLSSDPYSCFLFSLFVGMVALVFSYSTAIWQRGWRTSATGALLLVIAAAAAVFANMATEYVLTIAYSWHTPPASAIDAAKLWGNYAAYALGIGAVGSWLLFPDPVFGAHARFGNILWTLYSGTTGFVQDVLSHMRLFGIALSGGIMALVVNEIGGQFPLPATIAFAILGHGFVYLLSLLSLYIHTNRLIFLEFGSKCIDGGQNEYSPLRRRSPA